MDYSLLLGIHRSKYRLVGENQPAAPAAALKNSSSSVGWERVAASTPRNSRNTGLVAAPHAFLPVPILPTVAHTNFTPPPPPLQQPELSISSPVLTAQLASLEDTPFLGHWRGKNPKGSEDAGGDLSPGVISPMFLPPPAHPHSPAFHPETGASAAEKESREKSRYEEVEGEDGELIFFDDPLLQEEGKVEVEIEGGDELPSSQSFRLHTYVGGGGGGVQNGSSGYTRGSSSIKRGVNGGIGREGGGVEVFIADPPQSPFTAYKGGVRATVVEGPGIYYLGIIDVLQKWTLKKRLENWFKSRVLCQDTSGISAVSPGYYAKRFRERVLAQLIEGYLLKTLEKKRMPIN